jgi:hypothetical protein
MKIVSIYEADVVDGVFLGVYQEELGQRVVNSVISSMPDVSVDFGGGERDVTCLSVIEACGGSAQKLARLSGITRKEADEVLSICTSAR